MGPGFHTEPLDFTLEEEKIGDLTNSTLEVNLCLRSSIAEGLKIGVGKGNKGGI